MKCSVTTKHMHTCVSWYGNACGRRPSPTESVLWSLQMEGNCLCICMVSDDVLCDISHGQLHNNSPTSDSGEKDQTLLSFLHLLNNSDKGFQTVCNCDSSQVKDVTNSLCSILHLHFFPPTAEPYMQSDLQWRVTYSKWFILPHKKTWFKVNFIMLLNHTIVNYLDLSIVVIL